MELLSPMKIIECYMDTHITLPVSKERRSAFIGLVYATARTALHERSDEKRLYILP